MSKLDPCELEVLNAYEAGQLKPVASKADLQGLREAARATAINDKNAPGKFKNPAVQPACKGCATSLTPNAAHTRDTVSNLGSLPGRRAL
jgi:hypothetical protein